ncbi:MAG: hypothetical protein ACP5T2_07095, partial [Thermoprotei archaeon]
QEKVNFFLECRRCALRTDVAPIVKHACPFSNFTYSMGWRVLAREPLGALGQGSLWRFGE